MRREKRNRVASEKNMSRQTIALLLDSAPITWTSQEDRHLLLCQTLIEQDIQPVLVFSEKLRPEIDSRLRASGAVIEAINYEQGIVHYYRELRKLVERFSITTAHIIFFDYFSVLPWLARLAGIRNIIYEMQNSGMFTATSWKRSLLRLRTKLTTMPMTRVVTISEFVKQQLLQGGLAEDKIAVRYLGVDTKRFAPNPAAREQWNRQFGIGSNELIMSTVSYLRAFKNPHVLVETCKKLVDRNIPVRLFVAGDGELLPELKELGKRLSVDDRIHWLGNVPDPASLLQASDIFVLASVGEAFGLVLAEAMACAVPVVGSRSGSLPEVVDDGYTGILANPLDANAFADAIELLANDAERRRKMGSRALCRVRQHFTVERAVQNTLQVYETLWRSRATSN
jgi:glycosyltransferase involved in cell wall biosynthesis